jgi:O-antigen/teichoic acid export membrane protein
MFLKRLIQEKIHDIHFRDVLRGGLLFLIFRGLAIPAGFVFTWWVSRYYGADVLGVCTVLFSIWGLVETGVNSSLKQYMVRNLAALYLQGKTALYQASVYRILKLGFWISLVLAGALMLMADVVAVSFFDRSYTKVIFYTAPVLVVLTVSGILQENLRLSKHLQLFNFLSLAAHGLFALFMLLILHYSFSFSLTPLWAHLSAIACTFTLSLVFSVSVMERSVSPVEQEQPEAYRSVFRVLAPLFVSAAGANLNYQIPLFLLSYFHSEHAAGIYAVLFTISRLVALPLMVVNYNIAPKFVELLNAGKKDALQQLLHQNSRMLTIVSGVVFTVIVLFPKQILALMGSEYSSYTTELYILCGAQLVNVWAGSVNILMVTSGNEKTLSLYHLALLAAGIISGWLLIAPYGLTASVVIRATIMVVMNILLSVYLLRKLGLRTFWWSARK